MKRTSSVSPSKGVADGGRKKGKRRLSNLLLRAFLFLGTLVMILPIAYLQFNDTSSEKHLVGSTFQKHLESFRDNREQKVGFASPSKLAYDNQDLILTAYMEPPDTILETGDADRPFIRNTSKSRLRSISFPNTKNCSTLMQNFPVDKFPTDDSWLPWIHDYFPSVDRKILRFVAQNRLKCDTGEKNAETMKFWAPQVSLFQGIPLVVQNLSTTERRHSDRERGEGNVLYRFASSFQEATHPATRFQCRFHRGSVTLTTLSIFHFDYEFINWRKKAKTMIETPGGRDNTRFWLSQLMFGCPIPDEFQPLLSPTLTTELSNRPAFHVDLIPIRTPVRSNYQMLFDKVEAKDNNVSESLYLKKVFGTNPIVPPMDDAGRWQNLPICRRFDNLFPGRERVEGDRDQEVSLMDTGQKIEKPYRLVACTWASANYKRRGDTTTVSDTARRLREWIEFHLMVGIDHIYVYDNTDMIENGNVSAIYGVSKSFGRDRVTYNAWPCKICNNNRPSHSNPGERSSQYAAESSCRERYGELTDWMTFIDIDEYMVPMKQNKHGEYVWGPVLDEMDEKNISVMKFLSSRGKPRMEFMEQLEDQSSCVDTDDMDKRKRRLPTEPCVGQMKKKTFLQVYNCEYIRPPKPKRFERAMKQIYRPSFVLSHYVHYSTITKAMDESFNDFFRLNHDEIPKSKSKKQHGEVEVFVNELTQGALVHTRTVFPHETRRRSAECMHGSNFPCTMGFLCEDTVEFVDKLHNDHVFRNSNGIYCNCWRNRVIDDVLVPNLEKLLWGRSQ